MAKDTLYSFTTHFRDDQEINVIFTIDPADHSVGLGACLGDFEVRDVITKQYLDVTDDEYELLADRCFEHAQDEDDYQRDQAADIERDSAWDRW